MQSALISKAPGWKRDGCGLNDLWRAKFRLFALGHFELTGPDASLDVPNNTLAGLLAYLACTAPKQQPERKLATLLSGSHFDTQARQNLRQPLFRLRRVFGSGCTYQRRRPRRKRELDVAAMVRCGLVFDLLL
jgi:hypothetical protein